DQMPNQSHAALVPEDYESAARKLRDMVTTIEFTMISVIAGVMLFPWMEAAAPLVRNLQVEYWVYAAGMLITVMFYWVALIDHAMTFVGWPIDIIHNLFYLLVFPAIGVLVHFIADPPTFYPMFFVTDFCALLLTSYDLYVIRSRLAAARGAEAELFTAAYSRQATLVRYVLAALVFAGLSTVLINAFPDFFIGQHAHVVIGVLSLLFVLFLLLRECAELNGMRNRMLRRMAEEMASERQARRPEEVEQATGPAV
ncbi:MAG: hypothetical protein ACM3JD_17130, partial [Rudaea sp.]